MRTNMIVFAVLLAAVSGFAQDAQVSVEVTPGARRQAILGWGKTTPWLPAQPLLREQCIDRAVNDLGLNRLRCEGLCGNRVNRGSWEWLNDNDDPATINWKGFNTEQLDRLVTTEWLIPWKRAVEARGEPFDLYVSPSFFKGGSSGDLPPWMLADPQEYAEWVLAVFLRLRDEHGIVPNYISICNEAGNNNVFSPAVVLKMMKALMPRLREHGFSTTVEYPESINPPVALRYLEAAQSDPEVWKWIGLISYHLYGQKDKAILEKLRDFAYERGLPTAQTEFMDLTIDNLYDDMVFGGVSYWEIYGLGSPDYQAALTHVSSSTFNVGKWYWRFRQVSHFVRPGAVRVECTSSDQAVRCLAYEREGRLVVVLINTTPPHRVRTVTVRGLRPGAYGVSHCIKMGPTEELGVRQVGEDRTTGVKVQADSVLTIYGRDDANRPPTLIEWCSQPEFLKRPADALELRCTATDPERDALKYAWSVVSQPEGAGAKLAQPDSQATRVTGLTRPGEYVFRVAVSDGQHTVGRDVLVRSFEGNQPPVPVDVHNRIPVWVRVKDGCTVLRAGAWDIERDPLSFRWTVVRQPNGAAAQLETPEKPACKVT
ncbi:MAG TPA: hypothetical protein VM223_01850, partial [Planctomycetota bacterium]|nr:hypothetical protein [Planctomycetota bacterium]